MKKYTLAAIAFCVISHSMHAGVTETLKASHQKIAHLKQNVKASVNTQDLKLRCKTCNFRCRKCDKV